MMNVYLIDGTYEPFRSFFGAPSSECPQGREVGAVCGVIGCPAAFRWQPSQSVQILRLQRHNR